VSWSYYALWLVCPLVLGIASAHPAVIGVVVVALVARRWLPDPYLYFKYAGRIRSLRTQIEANPDNAAAQRELALIFLDRRRPAKALAHVERAQRRDPESAELLYLHGLALKGARRFDEALAQLVAATQREPRLRYGDAYLKAGDVLRELGRLDDAEDAYGRMVETNNSSVEGRYKLARVQRARGDRAAAARSFADARATYRQLPGFRRRKEWTWAFRAWLAA
jgi:tetratricopeptide (TPR) repeat protein